MTSLTAFAIPALGAPGHRSAQPRFLRCAPAASKSCAAPPSARRGSACGRAARGSRDTHGVISPMITSPRSSLRSVGGRIATLCAPAAIRPKLSSAPAACIAASTSAASSYSRIPTRSRRAQRVEAEVGDRAPRFLTRSSSTGVRVAATEVTIVSPSAGLAPSAAVNARQAAIGMIARPASASGCGRSRAAAAARSSSASGATAIASPTPAASRARARSQAGVSTSVGVAVDREQQHGRAHAFENRSGRRAGRCAACCAGRRNRRSARRCRARA